VQYEVAGVQYCLNLSLLNELQFDGEIGEKLPSRRVPLNRGKDAAKR